MKQEDFMEVAKDIKSSYGWLKYLERNNDTSCLDMFTMSEKEISEKLYETILKKKHEEVDKNIKQIRLLNYTYRMVKTQYSREVSFYGLLKSLTHYNPNIKDLDSDEFGGIVEDLIECSVPNYIDDLHVHCNNEEDWIEFICNPSFKLEDLENGKIKFVSEE
jgi:hypothetical protein